MCRRRATQAAADAMSSPIGALYPSRLESNMRGISWRTIAWLCAAACLGTTATAQDKLIHKRVEGCKLVYHTETKIEQTLNIAGMDVETKSQVFVHSEHVEGQRAADGTLRETQKVTSMQVELQLPGGLSVSFDSANPDKPAAIPELEPVLQLFRVTLRTPTTLVYDRNNELQKVEFPPEALASLDESSRSEFDPEKRKKQFKIEADFLPAEPVKPGDKWERSQESYIGGGQTFYFRTEYQLTGVVDKNGRKLHRIVPKPLTVSYAMEANAQSPLKVINSELAIADSEGEILFDAVQGIVHTSTQRVRITGPMTFAINGQEFPGKLDLTIRQKTELQP
jgi:hypothetical protein